MVMIRLEEGEGLEREISSSALASLRLNSQLDILEDGRKTSQNVGLDTGMKVLYARTQIAVVYQH